MTSVFDTDGSNTAAIAPLAVASDVPSIILRICCCSGCGVCGVNIPWIIFSRAFTPSAPTIGGGGGEVGGGDPRRGRLRREHTLDHFLARLHALGSDHRRGRREVGGRESAKVERTVDGHET